MRYIIAGLAAFMTVISAVHADELMEEGEKVFRKCKACHKVGEDAKPAIGPALNNIFGQQAGAQEEFAKKYSDAMIEAGEAGLMWTEETLSPYLENPRKMIEGTKMSFPGLKKEEDREAVIAYLKQFSPDYSPEQ